MMSMVLSDSDWDCYSGSSDDEGQDEIESMYGGHAQSILSSLEESIGKIDDFLSFEGGFLPGDIICSVEDPSGQMGRVVDVDMAVDLEAVSGAVIKSVNSKKLLTFRAFTSGDYVVCGQWLGKVVRVVESVTVLFDDGAKYEIRVENPGILEPVSTNSLEDALYPYYPGQRVRVRLPSMIKCGFKANHELGIICHVEVGLVQVNWISYVGNDFNLTGPTPSNLQDPKDLILLACFSHANWQVGDWCLFPLNDKEEFCTKEQLPDNSDVHSKGYKKHVLKRGKAGWERIFVIVKTKSKVDVIWQDGNYSVGLDAQTLMSVDNIGIHEFWPEQFVLKKVLDDNLIISNDRRAVGIVKSMDPKERTVRVKWMHLSPDLAIDSNEKHDEEIVSAYELTEHPDFSYCTGDVVVRMGHSQNSDRIHPNHGEVHDERYMGTVRGSLDSEHFGGPTGNIYGNLACIGIVNGLKDGGVEVKWASGVVSKVHK